MSATQGAPAPVHAVLPLPVSSSPDPFPLESARPYVYLLATTDRRRIKIGRSLDPLDRITGLLNLYPDIDLSRSAIIAVDTLRIELVLHIVFSDRRQRRAGHCDGHTEWFAGDFAEEVITFCEHIAHQRRVDYPVLRNLDAVVRAYRQRYPLAGLRAPRLTEAARKAAFPRVVELLTETVLAQTAHFVEILNQCAFDAVWDREGRSFLVRTVHRPVETGGAHCHVIEGTDWRRRLLEAAQVSVRVERASCCFHFVNAPTVEPVDEQRVLECYRIAQGPEGEPETADALASVVNRAFRLLWQALAPLERWEGSGRTTSRDTALGHSDPLNDRAE